MTAEKNILNAHAIIFWGGVVEGIKLAERTILLDKEPGQRASIHEVVIALDEHRTFILDSIPEAAKVKSILDKQLKEQQ